jgi:hypothetical protein
LPPPPCHLHCSHSAPPLLLLRLPSRRRSFSYACPRAATPPPSLAHAPLLLLHRVNSRRPSPL